ncbi:MAG: hypothetical protein QXL01_00385 [Thermoplasmatales archaeon]
MSKQFKKRADYNKTKNSHECIGKIYGYLKVLGIGASRIGRKITFSCLCECGTIKDYRADHIKSNKIKSCGCLSLLLKSNSLIRKYGTDNVRKIPHVNERIKQTFLQKYGSESYLTSQHYYDFLKNNPNSQSSKPEQELFDFVKGLGVECYKKRIDGIEFDVYIPEIRTAIEHNGLFWHSEFKKDRNYHKNKMDLANSLGIRLIQIFEHEWANNRDQVKGFLKSVLQKKLVKVGARKCEIKEVPKEEAALFLNRYHIQGYVAAVKSFGLFRNNELLSLITIGRYHEDTSKLILSRFVTKEGYTVQGGLSRLTKYAANYFGSNLISWCDLRWSEGNAYRQAGWELNGYLPPDYFYYDTRKRKIISKQSRVKKKIDTSSYIIEQKQVVNDGLYRVWDCGKLRFEYKYNM